MVPCTFPANPCEIFWILVWLALCFGSHPPAAVNFEPGQLEPGISPHRTLAVRSHHGEAIQACCCIERTNQNFLPDKTV